MNALTCTAVDFRDETSKCHVQELSKILALHSLYWNHDRHVVPSQLRNHQSLLTPTWILKFIIPPSTKQVLAVSLSVLLSILYQVSEIARFLDRCSLMYAGQAYTYIHASPLRS